MKDITHYILNLLSEFTYGFLAAVINYSFLDIETAYVKSHHLTDEYIKKFILIEFVRTGNRSTDAGYSYKNVLVSENKLLRISNYNTRQQQLATKRTK